MSAIERPHRTRIHPLHAFLLAATVPLFLGALLSDAAYARTQEIQWTNFASWLIAGGLVPFLAGVLGGWIGERRQEAAAPGAPPNP